MKKLLVIFGLTATVLLAFESCKKEVPTQSESKGTMTIKMTDAPGAYSSLNVEISKIEAYLDQKGWVTLTNNTQVVSVLSLTNGTEVIIANTSVDAGLYSKLRLTFGSTNSLTLNADAGGGTYNLGFGVNTTRQVEIEVNEQVQTDATTEILLDFNVATSIGSFGQTYLINPIITEIEDTQTGIQGTVEGASSATVRLFNENIAADSYVNATGNFLIRGIPDGSYVLRVSGISEETNELEEITIPGVIVVEGQIKNVETIRI